MFIITIKQSIFIVLNIIQINDFWNVSENIILGSECNIALKMEMKLCMAHFFYIKILM